MTIEITEETPEDYSEKTIEEVLEIGKEHWEEVKIFDERYRVRTNYFLAKPKDKVSLITARENGKVVGYILLLISESIFSDAQQAIVTVFYVKKEKRGSFLWKSLLEYAQEVCRARGIPKLSVYGSARVDLYPIMHRLGFSPETIIYSKSVGG